MNKNMFKKLIFCILYLIVLSIFVITVNYFLPTNKDVGAITILGGLLASIIFMTKPED